MIGLLVFGALVLYVASLLLVPMLVVSIAKGFTHSSRKIFWIRLFSFLIIFMPIAGWSIIGFGAHSAYCAKDSGIITYVTVEQWRNENGDTSSGIASNRDAHWVEAGNKSSILLSPRLVWVHTRESIAWWPWVWRENDVILDVENNRRLIEIRDYAVHGGSNWAGEFKGAWWMNLNTCDAKRRATWLDMKRKFVQLGDKK